MTATSNSPKKLSAKKAHEIINELHIWTAQAEHLAEVAENEHDKLEALRVRDRFKRMIAKVSAAAMGPMEAPKDSPNDDPKDDR